MLDSFVRLSDALLYLAYGSPNRCVKIASFGIREIQISTCESLCHAFSVFLATEGVRG